MELRKRILVVDDVESNRELLEALLLNLGHDVDMASSGPEALSKLDHTHDLILLDVMMAGMDGFEVARRIRRESPFSDIPICMVTALTGLEERLRAVESGANDYIAKPIDKTELRVRTATLLMAKEARDKVKLFQAELQEKNDLLQENLERLRKLSDLKDEFIGIATHDLKNPLSCVLGFASIINSTIPIGAELTAEAHKWVESISKHCLIMQRIIEDFLEMQALEDGHIKLAEEKVDLNALSRDVLGRNASLAAKKMITTNLDLDSGLLPINADKSRLNQVLENLLSNAIKFSPQGEQVTIRTRTTEMGALVEVRDSGPGITDEDMKKLFVKYAKLSNLPTGNEKSSGLGLAICKKIVEMLGGEIGARNNPEGGAAFWFELPGSGRDR